MQLITTTELHERISKGEKLNLVDVREPSEHSEFNIGGLLIPLGKIQAMEVDQLDALKDQELILYCRSGNRSGQACQILEMLTAKIKFVPACGNRKFSFTCDPPE